MTRQQTQVACECGALVGVGRLESSELVKANAVGYAGECPLCHHAVQVFIREPSKVVHPLSNAVPFKKG